MSPQDAKPVFFQQSRTPPPPPRISSLSFLALSALVFLTPSSKTQETVQVDNNQYLPVHECLSLRRAQAYKHHSSTPRSFRPGEGAPSCSHPVSSLATNAVHSLPRWRKINRQNDSKLVLLTQIWRHLTTKGHVVGWLGFFCCDFKYDFDQGQAEQRRAAWLFCLFVCLLVCLVTYCKFSTVIGTRYLIFTMQGNLKKIHIRKQNTES